MNPRHLTYFSTVVQRGSIKSAAEVLGVTQPAISSAVRKLESELGVTLLTRDTSGSAPTIYGRALYESAQAMTNVIDGAKRRISALRDPSSGQLRIGTGPSVPMGLIARMLAPVVRDHPDIRIDHLTGGRVEDFEQKLLSDDLDIAFCPLQPNSVSSAIDVQAISDNPIGMLIAAAHLPPKATSFAENRILSDFRWLVLRDDERQAPPGFAQRRRNAKPGDGPPALTVTVDDPAIVKHLTLTTQSIGFLPIEDVAAELDSGTLVELYSKGVKPRMRPIFALTKAAPTRLPTLDLFLESIAPVFKNHKKTSATHRRVALTRSV